MPGEERSGIAFPVDLDLWIVRRGYFLRIQLFVTANPLKLAVCGAEEVQQVDQADDLLFSVGLGHILSVGIEPVGITPTVYEFDSYASFIESAHVMGNALRRHPLLNPAIPVDVVVTRIPGGRFRVMNSRPEFPCSGQVGQLSTVNDDQVSTGGLALFEPLYIRQMGLVND